MATLQSECLEGFGNPEILGKYIAKNQSFCILYRFPDATLKYQVMMLSVKGKSFETYSFTIGKKNYSDVVKRADRERYRIAAGKINQRIESYIDIFSSKTLLAILIKSIDDFRPCCQMQFIILANALLGHDKVLLEQSIGYINEIFEKAKVCW